MAPLIVVLITVRSVPLSAIWVVMSRFIIPLFITLLIQRGRADHEVFYLLPAQNSHSNVLSRKQLLNSMKAPANVLNKSKNNYYKKIKFHYYSLENFM